MDNLVESAQGQSEKATINYDDPEEVANLMAWHLAKIFQATFKEKLDREVEKLKSPEGQWVEG